MIQEWNNLIISALTLAGVIVAGAVFATLSYSFINYGIILKFKSRKAKKLLSAFHEGDEFWNLSTMIQTGKYIHVEVLNAWRTGSFSSLKHSVTPKLKIEWMSIWKKMRQHNYHLRMQHMEVETVEVISVTDHFDNDKDSFELAVTGVIRRFFYDTKNKCIVSGFDKNQHNFVDILSFKRENNVWLLDDFKMDARIMDLLKISSKDFHDFVGVDESDKLID